MMNYLENGNIINSVNFPKCDMGAVIPQDVWQFSIKTLQT